MPSATLSSRPFRGGLLTALAAVSMALLLSLSVPSSALPSREPTKGPVSTEERLDAIADRLTAELGAPKTGGSYIDRGGKLVVTVTDRSLSPRITAAGATPKVVRYGSTELNRVMSGLDRAARSNGAGKVQGWYVDVTTNTVVVTTSTGAKDRATTAFLARARALGDKVRIAGTGGKATLAANLYGGQQINMSSGFICSNGFNTRTATGAKVLLTAGHCAEGRPTFSRNGVRIGSTRAFSFPVNDYAAVNVSSAWTLRGAVNLYNGSVRAVKGKSIATVGSSLCKSGRTTGWTCGTIQAYNQTVNYGDDDDDGDDDIVSGLVRHSACVQQGDSGGSNLTGNLAQGLTSGGQLYQTDSGALVCGQKVQERNVSFYQPVGEALTAYGLTLVTS